MNELLKKKKASGFTIIEVIIVLAIAGLIMVIVFIAVPQLQRNQRDNARQNVANRVNAEMETYAGNNQGQYPFDTAPLATFTTNYFNNIDRRNPRTGENYVLSFATGADPDADDPGPNEIVIYRGADCDGENADGSVTGAAAITTRQFALRVQLDRATTYYCVDNT